jgi:hypothetical protein
MPYPFAHPAALLPLAPLMGRFAVPSALVIGSIVPDLWQVLPSGSRDLSHSGPGLLFFCLPVGLAAYLLFHLLLKTACIALLPPALAGRVRGFAVRGLPAVPWHAVLASLVAGALTHLLWDGLTHAHGVQTNSINWLQHASTLFGTLVLAWWLWRKVRSAQVSPAQEPDISPAARAWVWALLLAVTAASAGWSAYDWPAMNVDLDTLRKIARTAASAALQGFAVAALLCCAAWKLR